MNIFTEQPVHTQGGCGGEPLQFFYADAAEPDFAVMVLEIDPAVAEGTKIGPLPELAGGYQSLPVIIPENGGYDIFSIQV